jgi:hypothetical protein
MDYKKDRKRKRKKDHKKRDQKDDNKNNGYIYDSREYRMKISYNNKVFSCQSGNTLKNEGNDYNKGGDN